MEIVEIVQKAALAAVAASGFAMLFNVPRRALALCALCGAVGVGLRVALLGTGQVHLAMATFGAAVVVAFIAELFSRRMGMPPALFSVPGVIPMIPGMLMFRSVVYWLGMAADGGGAFDEVIFGEAMHLAATAMLILAAIAMGVAAPNLIFYRRRHEA